jgi:AraC-like DNA-binding protein
VFFPGHYLRGHPVLGIAMNQQTLPYDITANRHGGNAESRAANAGIHGSKKLVRDQVMAYAMRQSWHGITADQVAEAFGCSPNHVAPRISELGAMGRLLPTDQRRKTRAGCTARVLIARK